MSSPFEETRKNKVLRNAIQKMKSKRMQELIHKRLSPSLSQAEVVKEILSETMSDIGMIMRGESGEESFLCEDYCIEYLGREEYLDLMCSIEDEVRIELAGGTAFIQEEASPDDSFLTEYYEGEIICPHCSAANLFVNEVSKKAASCSCGFYLTLNSETTGSVLGRGDLRSIFGMQYERHVSSCPYICGSSALPSVACSLQYSSLKGGHLMVLGVKCLYQDEVHW